MVRVRALLLLALAACGPGGEGPGDGADCGGVACLSELVVRVSRRVPWSEAEARLIVEVSGRTITCVLPAFLDDPVPDPPCDDATMQLGSTYVDGVLQEAELTVGGLLDGGEVRVVVETDDAVLLDEIATPDWTRARPNGPDCPPVCWTGEVEITW